MMSLPLFRLGLTCDVASLKTTPLYANLQTCEEGAQTSIHLAVSEHVEGVSGKFFSDCRQSWMPPWGTDSANAKFLWEASEAMTGLDDRTGLEA